MPLPWSLRIQIIRESESQGRASRQTHSGSAAQIPNAFRQDRHVIVFPFKCPTAFRCPLFSLASFALSTIHTTSRNARNVFCTFIIQCPTRPTAVKAGDNLFPRRRNRGDASGPLLSGHFPNQRRKKPHEVLHSHHHHGPHPHSQSLKPFVVVLRAEISDMQSWTRLIRFVSAETSMVHIGEPVDKNLDGAPSLVTFFTPWR